MLTGNFSALSSHSHWAISFIHEDIFFFFREQHIALFSVVFFYDLSRVENSDVVRHIAKESCSIDTILTQI